MTLENTLQKMFFHIFGNGQQQTYSLISATVWEYVHSKKKGKDDENPDTNS